MSYADTHADRILRHDDGTVTLTLRKPLASKDGEIGFLTLRRPDLDDLVGQERQPGDGMDQAGWLIARLTGVAVAVFEPIDAQDGMMLSELVGEFLDFQLEATDRRVGQLAGRHADRITSTDDSGTLLLFKPLSTKDGEIAEITVRRPSWKEMKSNKTSTLAGSAKLIATLSGVGPLSLGKIDGLDALILGDIVSGFLGSSQPTGGV